MLEDELALRLKVILPESLANDLVDHFLAIRRDVVTATLERSSPGKFVETVVQTLQFLESNAVQTAFKAGDIDGYLKTLESRSSTLPGDIKLGVTRIARAMYTLRSKRGIIHKSGVDANIYDLRYLYSSAQWILSELVRHVMESDVNTSSHLVEFVQLPADPLVEDFGDRRLVLIQGTAFEELLVLLRYYYPGLALASQIHQDMDRRKPSTISNAIRATREQRLIEGNKTSGYKLTNVGYRKATDLVEGCLSRGPSSPSA